MPNRILRASLRQSQRWNSLSFLAQSLYVRILTLVDDYGRYEAHPQLLANECFPYGDDKGEPVSRDALEQSLRSICTANMAVLYEHEGKRLLQLLRWKEHARTDSKFPECPKELLNSKCCANAVQMITSPPSPSPSPTSPPSPSTTNQPNGYPSLDEVKAYGERIGCLPAEAERFWNHFEASGWIDKNGHPVMRWQNKLSSWNADSRAKPFENAHHASGGAKKLPSIHELRQKMEAAQRGAAAIKAAHCVDVAMGESWNDQEKRKEYFQLKKQAKTLNDQIIHYEFPS